MALKLPVYHDTRLQPSEEFRVLVESCRACFRAGPASTQLSVQTLDWTHFLRLARRHRVASLASAGISELALPAPVSIVGELHSDALAIADDNLRAALEMARLRDSFFNAGIALLFLKGSTVGAIAYKNPLLKSANDIDILVGKEDVPAAAKLLSEGKYLCILPDVHGSCPELVKWHSLHKELIWTRTGSTVPVELHSRAVDSSEVMAELTSSSASQSVEICPGIAVRTLRLDLLVPYLAVHGTSSAWFRLKWLADFAGVVSGLESQFLEEIYSESKALGARRALAHALLLTEEIFGPMLPESLLAKAGADPGVELLQRIAERQLFNEREPTDRPLGTFSIHLAQALMNPGLGFALRDVRRQLRETARTRIPKPRKRTGTCEQ